MRIKRAFYGVAILLLLLVMSSFWGNEVIRLFESEEPSKSIGATNNGKLLRGKRLPSAGPNFETYSRLGSTIGRTSVHSQVRDIILETYAVLEDMTPDVRYVYGETGWPWGGQFRPHRTHQNGFSVDFMVPVRRNGEPATLPTGPHKKFGYAVEFNTDGRSGDLQIDFESLVAHLSILDRTAREHGMRIALVVFAPDLQEQLFKTELGSSLKGKLRFNLNPSWVRHDDHYHVDFEPSDQAG